ncbi:MAG: universal stress protein [Bacteroidota bacterium]|nr:universal stress protein [Bacteroidota bacterium]
MKKIRRVKKSPSKQKKVRTSTPKQQSFSNIALKHILVPIDFSENSKKALRYAVPLAHQFNASITLINIVEPTVFPSDFGFGQMSFPDVEKELFDKAEEELRSVAKEIPSAIPNDVAVKTGIPFVEVTNYANDEQIDLIIVATHGRTGVEHILFGSTAEKIIRKAPCPVFVVRAEEHDFIDERV